MRHAKATHGARAAYAPSVHLLISWAALSATLWLTAKALPGFEIKSPKGAVGVAMVFGLLNYFLGTLLYAVLGVATLGIGFVFGFATHVFVIAILLKLTDTLLDSLKIDGFGNAVIGGLILATVTRLLEWLL